MKKLFLLKLPIIFLSSFIFLFSLFGIKTKLNVMAITKETHTYYIPLGMGDDSLLEDEDKIKVNGDVEWNIEGIYPVEYYDSILGTNVIKEYHVVKEEALENGLTLGLSKQKYLNEVNKDVKKIIPLNDESYYIIGNKTINNIANGYNGTNGYNVSNGYNGTYGYIEYYENNELVYNYDENKESEIISGCLTNGGIVVAMNIKQDDFFSDILVLSISYDNNILKQEILGEGMDTVKEIYCSNNQIFLICESDSKTQDFSFHLNDNRAICVMLLDEQNLMIKNKICIENNKNNNYLDSSYYDQTLSLLVNLNGNNGQYENNGSYNGTIVININQLLNVNNYFFIPDYNIKYLEMVSDSRQIYLFYQSYIDDTFYLSIYENAGLELETNKIITNDKITNIKACVTKSEGVYYSLVKYKDNNYYIDNIYSINSSSILPYSLGTTINDPQLNIISILETNDEISIIIKKNDCLEITNLKVFNFEKHNNQNEQYNNTFYFVTLDGKSLSKEYFSTTPSFDTFGKKGYFVKYILDDYTTLVVKEVYDVFLNVNVKENEIYDIGLKLSFNGIGYLNQEEITSGYIINNPGSYSLHLIGNNNEEYTINFSVKKITIPDNEREENNLELQEQEKKVEHKKQETSIQNTVLPYEEKTNVTGIIILLALIIISSISAFFYYRKEKKK